MNILKRLNYIVLALGFVVFTACEDDFNQDDLLELQQTQLDAAIAALNNSGQFASAIVQVVTADNQPVSGATVTLTTAGDSLSGGGTQSATTGADGVASFSSVVAGGNWVSVSAAGFYTVIGTAEIGEIQYEVLNGGVVPIKSVGSAIIPLVPSDGSIESATISGRVTIQTDLTSEQPEIASGIVVSASLEVDDFLDGDEGFGANFSWNSFKFDEQYGIGVATTDSVGGFSFTVPAFEEGLTYYLNFPEVSADQIIAISSRDGVDLTRNEIDTVTTTFGPAISVSTIFQYYGGIYLQFDGAPDEGTGFDLTFTEDGRGVAASTWDDATYATPAVIDGMVVQITDFGGSYIGSPLATMSDPDGSGSGLAAEVHAQYGIRTATVGGTLTGYTGDINGEVPFDLYYDSPFNNYTSADPDNVDTTTNVFEAAAVLYVAIDGSGDITQDSVDQAISDAISNGDLYFRGNEVEINDWVQNLRLEDDGSDATGTGAVLTVTNTSGRARITQIVLDNTQTGYNGNYLDLEVSFSGGSGSGAAVSISQFETAWDVAIDNSNSDGYLVLPDEIGYTYFSANASGPETTADDNDFNVLDVDGNTTTVDWSVLFTIDASDSSIQLSSSLYSSFETEVWSFGEPEIFIDECEAVSIAQWWSSTGNRYSGVTFTENMGISAVTLWGEGTNDVTPGGNTQFNRLGKGYASVPTVRVRTAVVGGSGSGAEAYVNGTYNSRGEFDVTGVTFTSTGSGYSYYLNEVTASSASGTTTIFVKPGSEAFVEYDYGTGRRTEDVY